MENKSTPRLCAHCWRDSRSGLETAVTTVVHPSSVHCPDLSLYLLRVSSQGQLYCTPPWTPTPTPAPNPTMWKRPLTPSTSPPANPTTSALCMSPSADGSRCGTAGSRNRPFSRSAASRASRPTSDMRPQSLATSRWSCSGSARTLQRIILLSGCWARCCSAWASPTVR